MRLKTITASTMKDAMREVRETLGEDAIIIATREENGGKTVRVTAAVENRVDYSDPAERPMDNESWLYEDDDDEATVVEELTETMLKHSVPEDVLDQVVSCASVMGLEDSRVALLAAMETLFTYTPLPLGRTEKPLMLVGPPGAGKTLAAAKIAARGAMNGINVAVITTDTVRAGGIEQLEAFTRLMQIDLQQADTPDALERALENAEGADQILIDTQGTNPFDTDGIKIIAKLIGAAQPKPILVLPAGCDADESGEMARIFATIGVNTLLPTRLDVARRMGGLLAAVHQGGLSFAEYSDTAKVADGLSPLSPKRLTQLLMPKAKGATVKKIKQAG